MPIYTYRCARCGAELEVMQAMSDPPLQRHRGCRGKLQRTYQPVGIVLKGPGFHKTDYAPSKPKEDGKKPDQAGSTTKTPAKE